jgi:hypothetical protein
VFTFISDGQTLLLILALLYLTECLIWVKKQSVAFVSPFPRRWRIAAPISWLGNANGAMLILNPLPPPGRVFLSHLMPVSISPSGVCAFNSQTLPSGVRPATQTGEFLPFSAITQSATDGPYLVLNGQKFVKCATPKQAKALASLIEAVSTAKVSKREALVRSWVTKQFDARAATRVWSEAEESIGVVRWACSISFGFMFFGTPVLVMLFGLERLIIPLGVGILALAMQIAFLFYRAHRKLYPAESQERLESLVKMIVCPPVSLRAADVLTKNLLAEYSPVAVANVLTGAKAGTRAPVNRFVLDFVLDLQHPLKHEVTDEEAAETITWMNAAQLKACLEHVQRDAKTKLESLLQTTQREGDSVSYCPRCRVQFVVGADDECPDCPGVGLVAFADDRKEVTLSQTSG